MMPAAVPREPPFSALGRREDSARSRAGRGFPICIVQQCPALNRTGACCPLRGGRTPSRASERTGEGRSFGSSWNIIGRAVCPIAGVGAWIGGQAEYVMVPYADFNLLKFPDKPQAG